MCTLPHDIYTLPHDKPTLPNVICTLLYILYRDDPREFTCENLRVLASSSASGCKYLRARVRAVASTREFAREGLRVFASFRTRKLTLACRLLITRVACARSCVILACKFASHASHSHSFVNLRLSATVCLASVRVLYYNLILYMQQKYRQTGRF